MKKIIFALVIGLTISCSENNINTAVRNRTVELLNVDSTYVLENGMKVHIKEGTFGSEKVKMNYVLVSNASDYFSNNLLTQDENGKDIKTVGMIHLTFIGENGKELEPKKTFTLMSKRHNKRKVETFFGVKKTDNIVWKKSSFNNLKLNFKSDVTSSTFGELDLEVSTTLSLCNYLDSVFENSSFDSLKCRVRFIKSDGFYKLDTIKWYTEKDSVFENKLKDKLSSLKLENLRFRSHGGYHSELFSILIESFDVLQNDVETKGRSCVTTTQTGWFNFDIYINSPLTTLLVKNVPLKSDLKLISKGNDRCIKGIIQSDGQYKFEFALEDYTDKFKLYAFSDGYVAKPKWVELKQEKETHLNFE